MSKMKKMKYDERLQLTVLRALHETGLMSEEELLDYLNESLAKTIDLSGVELAHVYLAIQRWKARGAISTQTIDGVTRYKIAQIPPWFASCTMANLVTISSKAAKTFAKRLDEEYSGGSTVVPTRTKYKNRVPVEITFETASEILGTIPDGEMHRLYRDGKGKIIIPISWQKGYLRSNAPTIDATGSLQYHVGIGVGRFNGETKTGRVSAYPHPRNARKSPGEVIYESILPEQQFKTVWDFPMSGTKISNIEHLQEWLEYLSRSPIRGLGGNPYLKGGLIELVEVKQLPLMSFMKT